MHDSSSMGTFLKLFVCNLWQNTHIASWHSTQTRTHTLTVETKVSPNYERCTLTLSCSVLFHSALFHSALFHSIPFHSVLFYSIPFYSMWPFFFKCWLAIHTLISLCTKDQDLHLRNINVRHRPGCGFLRRTHPLRVRLLDNIHTNFLNAYFA